MGRIMVVLYMIWNRRLIRTCFTVDRGGCPWWALEITWRGSASMGILGVQVSTQPAGVMSGAQYSLQADWDCTSWEVPAAWQTPLGIQPDIRSLVDTKALEGSDSPIPLVEAGETVLVAADESADTRCSAHA